MNPHFIRKSRRHLSHKRLAGLILAITLVAIVIVIMSLPAPLNLELVDLEVRIHDTSSIDFEKSEVIVPILVLVRNSGTRTFEVSSFEFQEIVLLVGSEEHPMNSFAVPYPSRNRNPPGNSTRFALDYNFSIPKGGPRPTGMRTTIVAYLDEGRFSKEGHATTDFEWPAQKELHNLSRVHMNVALEFRPVTLNITAASIVVKVQPPAANLSFISFTVRPETLLSKKSVHIVESFKLDQFQRNDSKRYVQEPYLRMDWNKKDFPYDAYHTRIFIGVNGSEFPKDLARRASLNLHSANYIGFWDIDRVAEATVVSSIFTTSGRTDKFPYADSWAVINVGIGHPPDFVPFAEAVAINIPQILYLLSVPVAGIPFLVVLTMIKSRTRIVPWAGLIESLSMTIGAAVLVFIPIYGLMLDPLTSPFRFPGLYNRLYVLLGIYSAFLVFGIVVRVIARLK